MTKKSNRRRKQRLTTGCYAFLAGQEYSSGVVSVSYINSHWVLTLAAGPDAFSRSEAGFLVTNLPSDVVRYEWNLVAALLKIPLHCTKVKNSVWTLETPWGVRQTVSRDWSVAALLCPNI